MCRFHTGSSRRITLGLIFDIFRIRIVTRYREGMLNLYSVYSASKVRRLCALLCPAISFLLFHVLQFHVLQVGPSFSRPAISCHAHSCVNFTSVIFTSSIFSAPHTRYHGEFLTCDVTEQLQIDATPVWKIAVPYYFIHNS